jgi:hypothetical protein
MANMNLSDAVKIVQSLLDYQKRVRDDTPFFIMLSDEEWEAIEKIMYAAERKLEDMSNAVRSNN